MSRATIPRVAMPRRLTVELSSPVTSLPTLVTSSRRRSASAVASVKLSEITYSRERTSPAEPRATL